MAAFSKWGHINILYATDFVFTCQNQVPAMIHKHFVFAFDVISYICWHQTGLSVVVVLRYSAEGTCFEV